MYYWLIAYYNKIFHMLKTVFCVEITMCRVQIINELIETIFRWKGGFVIHQVLLNAICLRNNDRLIT